MKSRRRAPLLLSFALASQLAISPTANANPCANYTYANGCPGRLVPPPCPDDDATDSSGDSDGASDQETWGGCGTCGRSADPTGMPIWTVLQPSLNLMLLDKPLFYRPAFGPSVTFRTYYRQRGVTPEEDSFFSLGTNWSCSVRAYVTDNSGINRMHRGGAGFVDYTDGIPHFREGSTLTFTNSGTAYELVRPNGSRDVFSTIWANSDPRVFYFLTQRFDPYGNVATYHYSTNPGVFRLDSIDAADGKTVTFSYTNLNFPNRITAVTDPFSRVARLFYDNLGLLTNITDVIGMASSLGYDSGDHRTWITNLTTPYGSTGFEYGGTDVDEDAYRNTPDVINRYVEITPPSGNKHLYVFRMDSPFISQYYSPVPTNNPNSNTFDNVDQRKRNSYYWGPAQYIAAPASLSTSDYRLATLNHWLSDGYGTPTPVSSLSRLPSPDGSAAGQLTWFDYAGKSLGNDATGSSALPSIIAQVIPDGTTSYKEFIRDERGHATNIASSYTTPSGVVDKRTTKLVLAANQIDVLQEIGPSGEQIISNYFGATAHRPVTSYDALNQETRYFYNGNGQITGFKLPTGLTTTNFYLVGGSNPGRLSTNIDLEIGRTNVYTYADGLVYSHVDPRGLTTTNFWDKLLRQTGTLYPDGSTTSNVFTYLDVTGTKDRLGYWTYFGYSQIRQKLAETNANGVITRYGYCGCGSVTSVTNAWNTPIEQVTVFANDNQGNRTNAFYADGYSLTNWYNALGQVVQQADGTVVRSSAYNNQGLLTNVSNALGTERAVVLDIADRPIYIRDINGVTITNTYDDLGRLKTRTYPDGGVESFGYSARGMTAYTDQLGFTNFYAYDEAMRKLFETNANAEVLMFTNNAAGDLLALRDGKSQVTLWNFNEYGLATNKLDQAGVEIFRYQFDADRRLTNRWSKAKNSTIYSYDPVGNLTNVNYPLSQDLRYGYDALNRMTNMVDGVGTTLYAYTAGNQLFTEDGPWASDTVTNLYQNRLRSYLGLKQPTGYWANSFTYDAARRLSNVVMSSGTFVYAYESGSATPQPLSLLLPNTSTISNTYDNVARMLTTKLRNSSATVLDAYTYTYDLASQRSGVTRTDSSTVGYSYDKIGQLTNADSSVSGEDRGYNYDAAWNLTNRTINGSPGTFSVNIKNELTNAPSPVGTNTFDGNGNLVTSHNGDWVYTYDDENQLISVEDTSSTHAFYTELYYDGLLRLRKRLEYIYVPPQGGGGEEFVVIGGDDGGQNSAFAPSSTNWVLSSETWYVYDGRRVIQERNGTSSANTPTVSYTRGSDLSGSMEGAGGIDGLLARSHGYSSGSGNWSTHNYYHADGNGNITYLVDSSQALAASYRYDPYGNLISSSGSLANANVYRFSSKEIHVASGMYYYLYRWYEPNLQRWVNRDLIEESGGINLYCFSQNNPICSTDPFGFQTTVPICEPIKLPDGSVIAPTIDVGMRGGGNVFGPGKLPTIIVRPPSGGTGTNPPSGGTGTNPPSGGTGTNPPSGGTGANPPSGGRSPTPPNKGRILLP